MIKLFTILILFILLSGCIKPRIETQIDVQTDAEKEYEDSIPYSVKVCMEFRERAILSSKTGILWTVTYRNQTIIKQLLKTLIADSGFNGLSEGFKNKSTKYYYSIKDENKNEQYLLLDKHGIRKLIESMSYKQEYINCFETAVASQMRKENN